MYRSLAFASAIALAATSASAADTANMKLSHWLPTTHPLHGALVEWAESLEAASDGTIETVMFPARQLGKPNDHYDMARDGIVTFGWYNVGGEPGRFPVAVAVELPFTTANSKGGTAAFDAWYRDHAQSEMGDVHYCFGFVIEPGGIHSKGELTAPSDLEGKKVRAVNGTSGRFVRSLGGANVLARAPEMRDLIERGTIDIAPLTPGSANLFGITKATDHYLNIPFYSSAYAWVMNKATYEGLSEKQKAAVDSHCTTDWAVKVASPWSDFENAGLDELKADPDYTVVELSDDQLSVWRDAAAPLTQQWAETVKEKSTSVTDPDAALADYKALLKKNGAAY
ncbi:TRAP transporter substrate-binding protein [Amorphus coralli]|uniref:TRAP transporter substrate-binding protein n=1 Tax=Amorphus coralli TaxID=340680 RepID=UPI00036B6871|nr:TRAP transporter substrate-binding protein [Amorphus coralli]